MNMLTVVYNWLIGNMGVAGDYQYQTMHWVVLACVVMVITAVAVAAWILKKDPQKTRRLLVAVAVFQLCFEVLWRLIYYLVKKNSLVCWWPAYPCNLGGVLLPIIALLGCVKGKKMFYLFAFVGGVLTFAIPDGIFSSSILVFPIVKSILQHTGILMIPIIEYVSGTYRSTLKHLGWVIAGCLVHIANSEGIVRLLGLTEDYMFFRSGMPFVIPGVPQFITLSVFALLVLTILSVLADIKGSVRLLKRKETV